MRPTRRIRASAGEGADDVSPPTEDSPQAEEAPEEAVGDSASDEAPVAEAEAPPAGEAERRLNWRVGRP